MNNQKGSIGSGLLGVFGVLLVLFLIFQGLYTLFKIRWQTSESVVSGIVYNVRNDEFISGNTSFSIRAAVDTVVTEENKSSYCLPSGSPYIELINRASEDKEIKVIVRTSKVPFTIAEGATTCMPNVTVEEIK